MAALLPPPTRIAPEVDRIPKLDAVPDSRCPDCEGSGRTFDRHNHAPPCPTRDGKGEVERER